MTRREYVRPGRTLVIGRPDGTAVRHDGGTNGTWVDVPIDCPTLERQTDLVDARYIGPDENGQAMWEKEGD